MKTAYFERFSIDMTMDQALSASHPGPCDDDCVALLNTVAIESQLNDISPDSIRAELREYGAWDDNELQDNYENRLRIIWLAACDIRNNENKE